MHIKKLRKGCLLRAGILAALLCGPGFVTEAKAQFNLGMTGGLMAPTAEMNETGTFMIGGNFMPEKGNPFGYNTGNYFVDFTLFSFLELAYRETLLKTTYMTSKPKFNQQDRSFSLKVRVLKEGKYCPALAIGAHDPYRNLGKNYYRGSGSRGGATESGRRSWRSACSGWPIRICRSSWPWRLPIHGRRDFTARWASGSCRSGTATISYSAWRRILMDDLVFRRAGKTDLPHILAMQADIFHGEQGIPDDDVGAFLQKRPICWCAGSGGVLCAAAAAWQEGSETHWGRFVVLPAFRGRHIGSRLARFSFDDLFAMGVDRIHMDARETTVRIVCGMGGRIVGEPAAFYRGTVTPVVLERHAYRAI